MPTGPRSEVVDHTGDTAGAEPVVDVHHRHAVRARVEHAEQRRQAAEAEARRLAELQRIEDERRIAHAAVLRAEAAKRAAAESERRAAERAMLDQEVKQAEFDQLAQDKRKAEEQAEALRVQQAKLEQAAAAAVSAPSKVPSRASGMVVRNVPKFEVLDIWQVPRDFVRIEPHSSAILDAIRKGVTEIPGLKVWFETPVTAR